MISHSQWVLSTDAVCGICPVALAHSLSHFGCRPVSIWYECMRCGSPEQFWMSSKRIRLNCDFYQVLIFVLGFHSNAKFVHLIIWHLVMAGVIHNWSCEEKITKKRCHECHYYHWNRKSKFDSLTKMWTSICFFYSMNRHVYTNFSFVQNCSDNLTFWHLIFERILICILEGKGNY